MFLAADIGTSSIKACVAADGEMKSVAAISLPRGPVSGEQNPDEWLTRLAVLIKKVTTDAGIRSSDLRGIAFSGHSPSLVPVDREGRALYPCLLWSDRRASKQVEFLRERLGGHWDPSFFEPKILWFRDEKPDLYDKTEYFLQPKDYITYQLTKEAVIDRSAAAFMHWYSAATRSWQPGDLPIDVVKLPAIRDSWQEVGKTTSSAQSYGLEPGIPVMAGGIDAYCETLGAGVVEPQMTVDSSGTSTCIAQCLSPDNTSAPWALHVIPERRLLILPTSFTGGCLKWYMQNFGRGSWGWDDIPAKMNQSPPGAKGLLFLPYLAGARSPLWNPKAKGVFFGLSIEHSDADLLRAVLEGTAMTVRNNLDQMKTWGLTLDTIRTVGGGASNSSWNQIKADICGYPYAQMAETQGALLGAIILAELGVGQNTPAQLASTYTKIRETFVPNQYGDLYDEQYDRFCRLYAATNELM